MKQYHGLKLQISFTLLSFFLLMLQLLPLHRTTTALSAPDTIIALALCWAVRAPYAMSTGMLTVVLLASDIFLQKPIGLATMCVVLVVQWLRYHSEHIRDMAFLLEWLTIGAAYCLIYGSQLILLKLVASDHADIKIFVIQTVGGIAFYPIAVAASFLLFGIRRTWTHDDTRERVTS